MRTILIVAGLPGHDDAGAKICIGVHHLSYICIMTACKCFGNYQSGFSDNWWPHLLPRHDVQQFLSIIKFFSHLILEKVPKIRWPSKSNLGGFPDSQSHSYPLLEAFIDDIIKMY